MAPLSLFHKLELHYFFTDNSHTMDAAVRNKCEAELLAVASEIAAILGIKIKLETEPYREGGLKEKFRIITKNRFLSGILASIIGGVITAVVSHQLNSDTDLDELQKQKLRLEIKKLEQEVNEFNRAHATLEVAKAAETLSNYSYKIVKHKSNFYKTLQHYSKVTHVSFTRLNEQDEEIGQPKVLQKKDFGQFILDTDELPSVLDEQAQIEIISPVLSTGPYKWKGFYAATGEPIDFYMKDEDFKRDIIQKAVSFRSGSRIDCRLEVKRKLSETGLVIHSSYAVLTVLSVQDGQATVETPQGKKLKKEKELLKNQLALF
ncbi:hypothetical protein EFA69_14695 [Rufibacter immobilis]|uniref:Uncharacterized protein n=1 Tax=Rufibacter immobilis TaxID=1348778 RepID=A0A3M9MQ96_9BACT|nr:hypothetical protein [Rufibacter immobilis]RNI27385.1 hypothetical protein EFA69_14695 [Rufibacter immobilis]